MLEAADAGCPPDDRPALTDAVAWLAASDRAEEAARLAAAVWRQWLAVGGVDGGRALLALALDANHERPSRWRALALYGDGLLAFRQGRQDDSQARNEEALTVAQAVGDAEAQALALVGLSRVAFRAGDNARVCGLARQALELAVHLDRSARAAPLHMLAAGTRLSGDFDAARHLYQESLELNRALGDERMVLIEIHNLAHVEVHRGNAGEAEQLFGEVSRRREGSDDPYDAAMEKLNGAVMALLRDDRRSAQSLIAGAEAVLERNGIVLDPDDQFEVDNLHSRISFGPR